MNKRIRKKRMKLDNRHIGEHVYSVKTIQSYMKYNIARNVMARLLVQPVQKGHISRKCIKALINYIYKTQRKRYLNMVHNQIDYVWSGGHVNEQTSKEKDAQTKETIID